MASGFAVEAYPCCPAWLQDRDRFLQDFAAARGEMEQLLAKHGKRMPAGKGAELCAIM